MHTIKTLFSVASCVICLGVASMASAASIEPKGKLFKAPGSITVTSPASFNQPVTCNITFNGKVADNGANASITSATVSGANPLCGVPVLQNLPWTLTPSSSTAGSVSGVMFKVLSDCTATPVTISGTWNNSSNTLSIASAQTVGKCKITALSVNPDPSFTVSD